MEIIAHRGASHDAPENTLAAIHLGWQQRADAVEIDVHFSRDGRLVVIHDDNTRKLAGIRKKVSAQTLAELQALDVGRWKHPRWAGERIPTLDDALATIPAGKRLFVEVKCGAECVPEFAAAFARSGKRPAQVVPIGFSLPTMQLIKERLPKLEVCWVVAFRRNWRGGWLPAPEKLVEQATRARLDGLDLGARGPVNAALVARLAAARLKTYIWTVDTAAKARQLIATGVHGITTNRPGWLRDQLRLA